MRAVAASLVGALALGSVASAAAAPPADMPGLVAWARQHLTGVDDWPLVGFNAIGIALASPAGATLRADGLVEGDIRQEFFEPVELDGRVMRSATARWRVDCAKQRFAVLKLSMYARNNLQDRVGGLSTDKPPWRPIGDISGEAIEAMCEAVQTGERLDPSKPAG